MASGVARVLDLKPTASFDEVALARRVEKGFPVRSADALAKVVAAHPSDLVSEATLRRARRARKALSREHSERLYDVARVFVAALGLYDGDPAKAGRFLNAPHMLLDGETPMALARANSAGADAVVGLIARARAGVAV